MNPIRNSISGGALAAAALFLTSEAHATGWCPTPSNNTISCNSCSKELTCNVNGFGINITGSGVTLDGKSYQINYSNGNAIYVTGFNENILNVQIQYPVESGIVFVGPNNGSSSYIYNLYTYDVGGDGVDNESGNWVTVNASDVLNSSNMGVYGNGRTDVKSTDLWGTYNWGGYWGTGANQSMILNSSFNANWIGADVVTANNVLFSGNTFSHNSYRGFNAESAHYLSLQKNTAVANYIGCEVENSSVSGYGNSWGTSIGGCP